MRASSVICILSAVLIFNSIAISQHGRLENGFTNPKEAKNILLNGLKEGKWAEYYIQFVDGASLTTDTTKATYYFLTVYTDGKPLGIKRKYSIKGMLLFEIPYAETGINGLEKEYDEFDGKLWMERNYVNNKKNGMLREYYTNSGKVWKETPYLDDYPNGIEKEYSEQGILIRETSYVHGYLDGVQKQYAEQGKLQTEVFYEKNQVMGRWSGDTATTLSWKTSELRSNYLPDNLFFKINLRYLSVTGSDCDAGDRTHCWDIVLIPPLIKYLDKLEVLYLRVNALQKLPDEIGALQHLKELDLSDNGGLSNIDPVVRLENLEVLSLNGCGITKLPKDIGKLRKLKSLGLTNCHLEAGELERIKLELPLVDIYN